ncbi:ribonuclease H [Senna tora]|uniref:Ribonuclease H n=1 Tax=Senna tora TaxID=362788 RepID=A0A834U0K9_9FABA|nr:ribonuclease H [Senna tora]
MTEVPIPGPLRPGQGEDHHRPPDNDGVSDQNKKKARKEDGSFSGTESRDAVRNPVRTLVFESSSDESIDPADPTGANSITIDRDAFDRLNFTLSDKEWKRLCGPFKKSLIIKLLGKTIGFKFLLRKDFALTGGPWIILDHYLIIRPWSSLFDPEEKIQKLAAWVNLPDLPIELYDTKFLYTLGKHIGTVLRIDVNTTHQLRGKYARLCVKLDLEKPLLSQYCVHGRARKIEYEGLHLICFECGVYGHDLEHCPIRKAREEKEKKEKEQNGEKNTSVDGQTSKPMCEVIERYGAWMSAQKPLRARRPRTAFINVQNHQNQGDNGKGSRFAILNDNDPEEQEEEVNTTPISKEGSETRTKIWTKARKNPVFDNQQKEETNTMQNLEMMELGSPIKTTNQEEEQLEMQPEPGLESVAMIISPVKDPTKEKYDKERKGGKTESKQNQNLKDKPPDVGKKKTPNNKGQSGAKMQSKGRVLLDINAKCIQKHDQFMSFELENQKKEKWGVIAVYANPHVSVRNGLWPVIEDICLNAPHPLVVAGDFNEIAESSEQRGGCSPDVNRCSKFKEWINKCNLIDLKPEGPYFTWEGPKRPSQEKLFKRLDRVLCTPSWSNLFSEAATKCLTRTKSDHHPILLDTERIEGVAQNRPFRFEQCWLQHKGFTQFLSKEWDRSIDHQQMLNLLSVKLKEWNQNTFGDIRKRKSNLTKRLNGIQAAIDKKYNPFLEKLGKELEKELEAVLSQEEELWFQKARCLWIRDGDRNTKYYHTKAIARRRKNKTTMLRNNNGDWSENTEEVKSIILDFYKNLFKEDQLDRDMEFFSPCWPKIDQGEWDSINTNASEAEIKSAAFSIGGTKAPGRDGFPASFYHKNWNTISGSTGVTTRNSDSRLWKELAKVWQEFYKNVVWDVGDGKSIDPWYDQWVPSRKLEEVRLINDTRITSINSIEYFVDNQGTWNQELLMQFFPEEVTSNINQFIPPNEAFGPDVPIWCPEADGKFSTSSAYYSIKDLTYLQKVAWPLGAAKVPPVPDATP